MSRFHHHTRRSDGGRRPHEANELALLRHLAARAVRARLAARRRVGDGIRAAAAAHDDDVCPQRDDRMQATLNRRGRVQTAVGGAPARANDVGWSRNAAVTVAAVGELAAALRRARAVAHVGDHGAAAQPSVEGVERRALVAARLPRHACKRRATLKRPRTL
eukprot:5545605-Prymnesium_polylepis.1